MYAQQQQQRQWAPQQQQQQQRYAAAPPPAAACGSGREVGAAQRFTISGCKHDVVGPIISGDYSLSGSNHGKPSYKKDAQASGLVVMMYFWDERDGAANSGWWIGPQVGGNMVWGHHPNRTSGTPPCSGWQAPHSSPADPSIVLTVAGGGPAAGGQAPQQQSWQQSQQQQSWQQPQQQQQQSWQQQSWQQQSWGQNGKGGKGGKGGGGGWQQQQQQQLQQQQEEMNRKRVAEQQARMAQQKAQQEEMQRKKAEEQRKQMEEMRKRQAEQKAQMAIRQVVNKVKLATPETFDKLKEELAQALAKDFDNCGAQKAKVQEESDKALEAAAQKVKAIEETRAKAEAAKKEAEKKRQEALEKAKELLSELEGLTEDAEAATKGLQEAGATFIKKADVDSEPKVEKVAVPVDKANKEAAEKVGACVEFLKTNTVALRALPPTMVKPAGKKTEEEKKEEAAEEEEKPTLQKLQKVQIRVNTCKATVDKEAKAFEGAKQTAVKRAKARQELMKVKSTFGKYTKGKDGMMTKKEIVAFAKGQYKFTLPDSALDKLFEVIGPDAKAVKEADFWRVTAAVGVARERAMDLKRKAAREEHEKEIAEQKEKLQASIAKVQEAVKAAEPEVTQAVTQTKALPSETRSLKSPAMAARADELSALIKSASEKVEAAKTQAGEFCEGEEVEKDLTKWVAGEKGKLKNLAANLDSQLQRATAAVEKLRADAAKKDLVEVKELSAKALKLLKAHQAEKGLTAAALFDAIDTKKSGSFGPDAFAAFVGKLAKAGAETDAMSDEDLARAFAHFDEEKDGSVPKEAFEAMLMVLMKVMKDVAITEGLAIKDAKSLRRLEVGEIVQALEAPVQEEKTEVQRVRARTMQDGLEGFITIAGNQGSVFLKEGVVCKVIKETILTDSFDIEASKEEARKIKEVTRKLKPGELLEVREWGKKQEGTGLTRMKCKVKSDGGIGYVTTVGNTGIKFVEFV